MKKIILITLLLASWFSVISQTETVVSDKALLQQLIEGNREAVDALVLYPEKTRNAIFMVAQYPETLIKIEQVQQMSSDKFTALLVDYPRSVQESVWDLTRFPGLVETLSDKGPQVTSMELYAYPEPIEEKALKLNKENFELIIAVNTVEKEAENAFEQLIKPYSPDVANAYRHLLNLPEVLDLLTENIRLTILVGDVFEKDPDWVREKLNELNLEVATEQARELEEWKVSLEENPEAKAELESFALDYAEENGYDELYYDPSEDGFFEGSGPPVVEHHYYHHYPYWYGYPYWYSFPRWRPFPVWYDWGFYVSTSGHVVVFGMPSYYFTNWYFYHPYHCYRYPWLGAHFVNWWYHHPYSYTSVSVSARNWGKKNPAVITESWMENRGKRVDQMRDFGQMEEARIIYNKKNPTNTLSQAEYVNRNGQKFPSLTSPVNPNSETPAAKPRVRNEIDPVYIPREKPSYQKPTNTVKPKPNVRMPAPAKPNIKPKPPKKPMVAPVKPNTVKPKNNKLQNNRIYIPKVNRAKNYHQQRWTKPAPKSRQAPKMQLRPSVRPTPKASTPTRKKN